MKPYITKAQAERRFRKDYLPAIKKVFEADGVPDWPARREAWNDFVNALIRNGDVPPTADWTQPSCVKGPDK